MTEDEMQQAELAVRRQDEEVEEDETLRDQLAELRRSNVKAVTVTPADLQSFNPFIGPKAKLERATGIINAATETNRALGGLYQAQDELLDVGTTLETNRAYRQVDLLAAQRRLKEAAQALEGEETTETSKLQNELEQVKLDFEIARVKRERETFDGAGENQAQAKKEKPKSKRERLLAERKRWRRDQEALRSEGLSEEDEEWELLKNNHEVWVRRILE